MTHEICAVSEQTGTPGKSKRLEEACYRIPYCLREHNLFCFSSPNRLEQDGEYHTRSIFCPESTNLNGNLIQTHSYRIIQNNVSANTRALCTCCVNKHNIFCYKYISVYLWLN